MEDQTKCSNEEHKEINAIIFCPECQLYMCNKCENHHATLHKKHHPYKFLIDIFNKISIYSNIDLYYSNRACHFSNHS